MPAISFAVTLSGEAAAAMAVLLLRLEHVTLACAHAKRSSSLKLKQIHVAGDSTYSDFTLNDGLAGLLPIREEGGQPFIGQRVLRQLAQNARRHSGNIGAELGRFDQMDGIAN